MRIYRSNPDDHFTIVPNATFRDERLTPTAKGVLIELLTHSDGWVTNADAMWRRTQRSRGGDKKRGTGRRAYREAFAELEACGYLIRERVRCEDGTFTTELHLYDEPQHRGTANGTSVNGTLVNGTSVSGTSSRSTSQRSNSERSTKEEHSTALADTRAATADAAARERERDYFYEVVENLDLTVLRNGLLDFERRRKKIYRECRNAAIVQYEQDNPGIFKGEHRARTIDRMAYKHAVLHYSTNDRWPNFLLRLLAPNGIPASVSDETTRLAS